MTAPTLGGLNLGTVKELYPTFDSRMSDVEVPLARGVGKQILGSEVNRLTLRAHTSGANRFENLQQIDRYRMIGESLRLTSDLITIPVYIRSLRLDDVAPNSVDYTLTLDASLFIQGHACDADTDWVVDSGGGALTEETATPSPREGAACLKLSGTINAATESKLKCTPADSLDFSYKDWVALWYYTNNVTDLSECVAKFYHDASNYSLYDFTSQVVLNAWCRVLIPKADFSENGLMEWDEVTYFTIHQKHNSQQTYFFAVDDVGAYE